MAWIAGPCGRSITQAAADFQAFFQALPKHNIAIFSDGSQLADRRTGGGYVGYPASRQITRGAFSLSSNKEVFDAEAEAALLRGAQAALNCTSACFATNLWVFLDNVEVAAREG
jgi:hypothetical protein